MNQVSKSATLQLNWTDRDGTITVTPESEDRFSMRIADAIEELQLAGRREKFERQFSFFLQKLAEWAGSQPSIKSAHLTFRSGEFLFLVVRENAVYDETFEDDLSDLDIELASDPDLDEVQFSVLSLPNVPDESLETFMDPRIRFRLQHAEN